jgi:hypothetical protein
MDYATKQEVEALKVELNRGLNEAKLALEQVKTNLTLQSHNGIDGLSVNFNDLIGIIKTVTSASELTNILAGRAGTVRNQIFIDTTTATKKLYIYDAVGNVWRSCTIA